MRNFFILIAIILLIVLGYYLVTKTMYTQVIHSAKVENVKSNVNTVHTEETVKIGGNFSLINQDGKKITQADFLRKYTMVLFGFSRCPHVCPNQLSMLTKALEQNANLQAFFISVDPKYDTAAVLKDFQKNFHPKIQMLTGDPEMINNIIKDYKVYVYAADDPEEFNHSTIIYLMGPDGKYQTHFSPCSEDELAEEIESALNMHGLAKIG